jgi:hypothetical protein
MTPEPELDALIQAWLDGDLDPRGEARLLELLAADPRAMERLDDYAFLHQHLPPAPPPPDLDRRVVAEIETRQGERVRDAVLPRLRVRARRRAPWLVAGTLAASFALAVVALLSHQPPAAPPTDTAAAPEPAAAAPAPERGALEFPERPPAPPPPPQDHTNPPTGNLPEAAPTPERKPAPPAVPRLDLEPARVPAAEAPPAPAKAAPAVAELEGVKGEVYVLTALGRERARSGQTLHRGETLVTAGRGSSATLRLNEGGAHLDLGPDTLLLARPVVDLEKGTITLRADTPVTVTTRQAKTVLSGKKVLVTAEPEATRVRVDEGRLQFTRSADGQSVDLRSGFAAVAAEEIFLGPVLVRGQDVRGARARLLAGIQDVQLQQVKEASGQLAALNRPEAVDALLAGLELCAKVNQALFDEQKRAFDEMRSLQPNPNAPVPKEQRPRMDELSVKYYDLTARLVTLADLRAAIQESFGAVTAEILAKELAESLAGKGDPNSRAFVAEALGRIKRPEAQAALVARLKTEREPLVRVAILDALAARAEGSREVVDAAWSHLADPFPQVGIAAARALRATRTPDAIPPLIKALKDVTDPRLREEINGALVALTTVDKHSSYDAWTAWWTANEEGVRARTYKPPKGELAGDGQVIGGTTFYGLPIKSDKIVFVIDYSNSMHKPAKWVPPSKDVATIGGPRDLAATIRLADNPTKVDVARFELKKALATLPDGIKFNIVFFNHTVWPFSPRRMETLNPETRRRAFDFIDATGLILGTDIFEAMKAAFGYAGVTGGGLTLTKSDVDTIIFLSDGLPWLRPEVRDKGVMDPDRILQQIRDWNKRPKVVIHTVQISADQGDGKKGDGRGQRFMRSIAEDNGGTYVGR